MFVGLYEVDPVVDLGKELLSHPHSKRNERKTEREEPKEIQTTFLFLLSSFVASFYLSVHLYVHLFVHILCLQTQAATTLSCCTMTTAGNTNIRIAEGYMACPLNVPSSHNPFPSLLLY